jgi:tetraacyldisaccharide 4'-kinase
MRAPDFWRYGEGGPASLALTPLGWLYGAVGAVRWALARPWKAPVPVICIGNLVAGGAGKTPVALDFGTRLIAAGKAVHFLTRGYGGTERGPLMVYPAGHSSEAVGDEALLLAKLAPTWVAVDRKSGCLAAAAAGADIIIMDDGFQNPSVSKDLSVVVIDGGYGFGNGRMIPAGPLREPITGGLKRCDAVVIIGDDGDVDFPYDHCPVIKGHMQAKPESQGLAGKPVVAFAGIGRPEKFFETLATLGCDIRAAHAFADHRPFSVADLERLRQLAETQGALLVTTEKDAVRLPADFRAAVSVVAVSLVWDDEAAITGLLEKALTL